MRNTSKFWVVVGVIALQLSRVIYFSAVWFPELKTNYTREMQCLLEWSINVPTFFEFLNIFVIHEFLLRVHLQITDQIEKHRVTLVLYTASISILYLFLLIAESWTYCN